MNVGDPATEAICWTAGWHMVTEAELTAADFVSLVTRRLRGRDRRGDRVVVRGIPDGSRGAGV